jgi:pyruvate kinase
MSRFGISLNAGSINEASVATFARTGASFVRFIAKGISPNVYVSLAESLLAAGGAIRKEFSLMVDLPGNRPRMGTTFDELTVFGGMTVLLVDELGIGDTFRSNMIVPTVGLSVHKDKIRQGDRLLVSDGATELKVMEILPNGILAEATRAESLLSPNRSILLPDSNIRYESLSDADRNMVDMVASSGLAGGLVSVSMVESAEPLRYVKERLPEAKVVAKIETRAGLVNRAEIVAAADAVMIARGDLSLSLGLGFTPAAVDLIVDECSERQREIMLATGIFDGVGFQGRPTIADLTDLWYYWRRGIRNFLLSGGQPDKHGRASLECMREALSDFRFAVEDLTVDQR